MNSEFENRLVSIRAGARARAAYSSSLDRLVGTQLSVVKFVGDRKHHLIRAKLEQVFGGGQIIKPASERAG